MAFVADQRPTCVMTAATPPRTGKRYLQWTLHPIGPRGAVGLDQKKWILQCGFHIG